MDVDVVATPLDSAAVSVNNMAGEFYGELISPASMDVDTVDLTGRLSSINADHPEERSVAPDALNDSVTSQDMHIASDEMSGITTLVADTTEIEDDNHSLDLFNHIKGYRLLQLISEQSSNGSGNSLYSHPINMYSCARSVDKVIISQDSLRHFINYISPGAFSSLTRIDFTALDRFLINPIGVYGSKSEIVRLLLDIGAVDDEM
jgi:hypothetical protein